MDPYLLLRRQRSFYRAFMIVIVLVVSAACLAWTWVLGFNLWWFLFPAVPIILAFMVPYANAERRQRKQPSGVPERDQVYQARKDQIARRLFAFYWLGLLSAGGTALIRWLFW